MRSANKVIKSTAALRLSCNSFVNLEKQNFERIGRRMVFVQTSANNSTPPPYSKDIRYSVIIRGRIVGQIVDQYSTQGRPE